MQDLSGKRALVTGSSRGIGKAIALALADAGVQVIVHASHPSDKAEETVRAVAEKGGGAQFIAADLSDPENAKGLLRKTGDVDILILNASIQYRTPWEQITVEDFYTQINCNLLASMLLIQQAVPGMRRNKWGRIVTVGSVQEAKPHPDMLVYSASKAAQTNMMHSLALQLAADGITVNNVAPGVIATDRNVEALSDPE